MRGRTWCAVALLLAPACSVFEDPSNVVDLRLLGAALEPAELILDPAGPGVPLPGLRLTPLVVDGKAVRGEIPERPITFTLRACANDPRAPSAAGAGTEAAGNYPAGGTRSTVGSARCPPDGPVSWSLPVVPAPADGAPAPHPTFTVTLGREALAAAFAVDRFPGHLGNWHGGFDLGLPINFEITARAGDEVVTGIKRLVVWAAPLDPQHRPNQNPSITEVLTYAERDLATLMPVGAPAPLAPGAPVTVPAGGGLWIEPRGAVAEPYFTTVVDRFTDQTRTVAVPAETLRFSFYATHGKFEPRETTSAIVFGERPPSRIPLEARYLAPAATDLPTEATGVRRAAVRVFIVVRDERGGASWTERSLVVTP